MTRRTALLALAALLVSPAPAAAQTAPAASAVAVARATIVSAVSLHIDAGAGRLVTATARLQPPVQRTTERPCDTQDAAARCTVIIFDLP